jgi:hypothetical protein
VEYTSYERVKLALVHKELGPDSLDSARFIHLKEKVDRVVYEDRKAYVRGG